MATTTRCACIEEVCFRACLGELEVVDADPTVGQLMVALAAGESSSICVGGKKIPEARDVRLKSLDIDLDKSAKVFVCPRVPTAIGEVVSACCPDAAPQTKPEGKLGIERFLTLWILLTVIAGIGLGQIPNIHMVLDRLKVGNTNWLTASGMITMLLPPFAAVRYDELVGSVRKIPKRVAVGSVVMNWVFGPLVMLFLGMATLFNHVDLLQGVVFIGAARCIAMVLVWTALADGDSFLCVSLVLLNSVITVVAYAPVVTILGLMAHSMGMGIRSNVSFLTVFSNVAIYLGIPLIIGVAMWSVGHKYEGYWNWFLPRFGPVGMISLLWTVLMMFTEMSRPLLSGSVAIVEICWVVLPLLLYFILMFSSSWLLGRFLLRIPYDQTVTFAFTAASNNFELALAACTAIYGTSSKQAVATVMGPLIEIPVMLLMVRISKGLRYGEVAQAITHDDSVQDGAAAGRVGLEGVGGR